MYDFGYYRPSSVADAVARLAAHPGARVLAGGQTLIAVLKQRLAQPPELIDLGHLGELTAIRRDGPALLVGAMATHASVAASPEVCAVLPALAALADGIGDPLVRNRGTLGGSAANADPAADYPAAIVALDATIETDRRRIAADDFFTGLFSTALEDDEIITQVSFPLAETAGYAKFPQPASRFAVVGVMVAKTARGVRVAVTGAGACVFRLPAFEAALGKSFTPSALDGIDVSPAGLNEDLHATPAFRAHLVTVMAKRAVAAAGA